MGREYRATMYPADTIEVEQNNLDMFFRFMNERHLIWHRRFIEKLPQDQWTNDPILKVTKYTNIYRELDRGSLWWLENVGSKYLQNTIQFSPNSEYVKSVEDQLGIVDQHIVKSISSEELVDRLKTLVWETVVYRLCNRIETFEETGIPDYKTYDSSKLENAFWAKLKRIAERGEPVMTSAHLSCPTPAGYTKYEGYILAVNDLHKKLDGLITDIRNCKTSKQVFQELMSINCVGNFIAYEVLCDLMYVKAIGQQFYGMVNVLENIPPSFEPFKEDDWANVGPGAIEGIRMLFPSTKGKVRIYERMVQLRDEQAAHLERLGISFKFYDRFTKGHLSLRSIEHSLCEFSKFWLQKHNLGKQRLKFNKNDNRIVTKLEGNKEVRYRIIINPNTGDSLQKIYL